MTSNAEHNFLMSICKWVVLLHQTQIYCFKSFKRPFSCSYYSKEIVLLTQTQVFLMAVRRESYLPKLQYLTSNATHDFSHAHKQGRVLPSQTEVHDFKYCKRHFSCSLVLRSLTHSSLAGPDPFRYRARARERV